MKSETEPKMLRTGDPCPCCGQPIKTKDPDMLRLLTYIRDSSVIQFAAHKFLEDRSHE